MGLHADHVPGTPVVDITGRVVGDVVRLVLDSESWAVATLEVKLRRHAADELGMRWSALRVPTIQIPTGLVMAANEVVLLRASLDELHGLVSGDHEPTQPAALNPA